SIYILLLLYSTRILGEILAKEPEVQDGKTDVDQIVPVFGMNLCPVIDSRIPRKGRKTWMC
ncbi:MAG: hypothetical protein VX579_06505, partial [Nitrospinota bacterium]|nr:hypothetical protein [Nitrospinota bacterium]